MERRRVPPTPAGFSRPGACRKPRAHTPGCRRCGRVHHRCKVEPWNGHVSTYHRGVLHSIQISLARLVAGCTALLSDSHRATEQSSLPADAGDAASARISLLSVVKQRGGRQYMAVEEITGDEALCAWIEGGLRRTATFPVRSLEVVPVLGRDDHLWREAFRAASHRKVG